MNKIMKSVTNFYPINEILSDWDLFNIVKTKLVPKMTMEAGVDVKTPDEHCGFSVYDFEYKGIQYFFTSRAIVPLIGLLDYIKSPQDKYSNVARLTRVTWTPYAQQNIRRLEQAWDDYALRHEFTQESLDFILECERFLDFNVFNTDYLIWEQERKIK